MDLDRETGQSKNRELRRREKITMLGQIDKDMIEALIDEHSLSDVVQALAEICREKAEHIRTNWQDDTALVRAWARVASKIDKVDTEAL